MPSMYVSPIRNRLQRRTMRDLDRQTQQQGLDPRAVDSFLQSNPDAMRYPSQARDQALDYAKNIGAARAAADAPYGSIAQRNDPTRYGSIASRENPGLRRRHPGVRFGPSDPVAESAAVDRRAHAVKMGLAVLGDDGRMTTDANRIAGLRRRGKKPDENTFTFDFAMGEDDDS